ncbi:MAG: isoleucine--tRNA ligase [Candidatus Methylacidiphilales bacterium]
MPTLSAFDMNYKDTLQLPKTPFPMRAALPQREPLWTQSWEAARIHDQLMHDRAGAPSFILHDGPPFANGDAHMGHALNMTLKDIVLKSRNMSGFRVPFIPGWDCHGLPIEHKVMKEFGRDGGRLPDPTTIRQSCQAMAEKYIGIQREQFQRLGVFGDWENPYITMEPDYEADVLRVFAAMVAKDMVFQALKPVYWSTGCRTALAEAEVEYADRTDPSVYVRFPLTADSQRALGLEESTSLLIWTTTPWTLPANLAVAVHPDLVYQIAHSDQGLLIFASGRLEALEALKQHPLPAVRTLKGSELAGLIYQHPFLTRRGTIHVADFVTSESGTGLVHIAPGHGTDDYHLGQQAGLEIFSPVDDDGCLTDACGMPEWAGKNVFDANPLVVNHLEQTGFLFASEAYRHSYPHCWRSKTPIVFRAVTQWFIKVDAFRSKALEAISNVKWIPAWGENRIRGAVETRPDWCISRQRTWGIPIPAFFDEEGGAHLDAGVIQRFADRVEEEGTDIWFSSTDEEMTASLGLPSGWKKGTDTLDVWIDSGSSHQAVTRRRLTFPADLYLEGSDQHRGWFQSSLLTSVAISGEAPYRAVLTNGFVVDLDGKKLSKSNTYEKPTDLMSFVNEYGADILRLWVSHEDYRNDVPFSVEIFKRVSDTYRSIRNTLRILLANLQDFDPIRDAVPNASLQGVDAAIHARLQQLIRDTRRAYEAYEFHQVYHLINRFCAVDLSSIYVDVTKDRMYCDAVASLRRRATQTVMHHTLETLALLLAPIMPFTCEEVWQYAVSRDPEGKDAEGQLLRPSIHLALFPDPAPEVSSERFSQDWENALALRAEVNEKLEALRRDKKIGKSLEAIVVLPAHRMAPALIDDLAEWLLVSAVECNGTGDHIEVLPAVERGWVKCPRCWSFHPPEQLGRDAGHPELCPRCTAAVQEFPTL